MKKLGFGLILMLGLAACGDRSGLEVTRMLFGYIEPPKAQSVMEDLKKAYQRCLSIDSNRDCVQIAYDQVRVTQGLDPKPIPKGYVEVIQYEMEQPAQEPEPTDEPGDATEKP